MFYKIHFFKQTPCDLGASINLMPYYIYKRLGLGEMKPTTVYVTPQIQFILKPNYGY